MSIPDDLFRTLVKFAPDAFLVTDASGRIAFANAQAEQIFGYDREELVGSSIERLVPERLRGPHQGHRDQYIAAPQARPMGIGLQLTARRRDGSEVPVEISLSPIYSDDGRYVASTVRDVSERRHMEDALRSSEQRYRLLSDNAEDIIYRFAVDPWPPVFEYASPSITAHTGYTPEQFMADPDLLWHVVHPDDHDELEHWLRSADQIERRVTVRNVLPDGEIRWHEQRFTPILDAAGKLVAVEGIARDVTAQLRLEEDRRLLLAETEIERERERIAADLHDGVMQTMYGVGLQISSILRRVPDLPEETRVGLGEAVDSLNGAMADIRRYVMDLRPADFTGHLGESLTALGRLFESTSGITVNIEADEVPIIPEPAAVELFLLIREALSNVRRHAKASSVTVAVAREGKDLVLTVVDDGAGFDVGAERLNSQFGLRNMETRARLMGASLDLESEPGAGTRVCLRLPLGGDTVLSA